MKTIEELFEIIAEQIIEAGEALNKTELMLLSIFVDGLMNDICKKHEGQIALSDVRAILHGMSQGGD